MIKSAWKFLRTRWQGTDPKIAMSYHATFSNYHGQLVLQHLLDGVYFTVYEGTDPQGAVIHNARRSVVQDILLNIDMGEHPDRYRAPVQEQTTELSHAP